MKAKIIFLLIIFTGIFQILQAQKAGKKLIISGTVTDEMNNPVPGAIIFIDKIRTNSTTNNKGFYKIKVSPAANEISAFSLGYGVIKDSIENRTTVNLSYKSKLQNRMVKESTENDERINIGYGSISKRDNTMQISQLQGQTKSVRVYTNIYEMIRGQVPGVEVNGKSIKISGADSFMLSSEPLFVVDGMIVESIDGLNPAEVKSIAVLKGASASIYGARGANGVILITMMSGGDRK